VAALEILRSWFPFNMGINETRYPFMDEGSTTAFEYVRNPGGMAIPFGLVLTFADGSSERVHRTPAAWQADGRTTEVPVAAGKTLKSVTLDTGIFVDANPGDNTWKAGPAGNR
jgi:hypothetical protein